MKIKWLLTLFALYVIIMLVSIFPTSQNNAPYKQPGERTIPAVKANNYSGTIPAAAINRNLTTSTPLPIVQTGITIIKPPAKEPKNEASNSLTHQKKLNQNTSLNVPIKPKAESSQPAAGITITGKRPSAKESQEMNSKGIVLY